MPIPDQVRRTANRHPSLAGDIRRIIRQYAMINEVNRGVILCQPRDIELRFHPLPGNPKWSGHNGKVCFATALDSNLAADAIRALEGADPVQTYPCPRGGHYHHVSASRRHRTVLEIMDRIARAADRHHA